MFRNVALTVFVVLAGLVIAGFRHRVRLRAGGPGAWTRGGGSLRPFLRPYRTPLVLAAVLTTTATALDLASPWPLKVVVDNAIGGRQLPAWLGFLQGLSPAALAGAAAVAGIGLVAASSVLGYLITYLTGAAAERAGSDIRAAAFDRLQRLSIRFHDANRTGDLVSRLLSDASRAQEALVAWFDTALPEALTLVGMIVLMFLIDVQLALAAVALVPLLAAFVWASRPRVKAAQRDARNRSGELATRATEMLRHVRAVRTFSRQEEEVELFRRQSEAATGSAITVMDLSARFSPVADLVLAGGTAVVLVLGVNAVISHRITLGLLLVVLAYLASLYAPIRSLSRLTSTLARGAASRERLEEILGSDDVEYEDPGAVPAPERPAAISLRRVSFAYRIGAPVLRELSLQVAAGETVCIVGTTGAGKSTLLSLLLRLYEPDGGEIVIGGTDIRRLRLSSLRDRVALVPQDPWVVDGTIAQNIAFGRAGATREEIVAAGARALVEEFVGRLPEGYDTVVGEGGAFLSGGQRRRIALARAILRNAPILLLDEPTSGLDAQSEALVMDALRQLSRDRTVLMVTHRLRVAEEADRVVVLEHGLAVEEGSPDELVHSGGEFARLWAQQHSLAGLPAIGRGPALVMSEIA